MNVPLFTYVDWSVIFGFQSTTDMSAYQSTKSDKTESQITRFNHVHHSRLVTKMSTVTDSLNSIHDFAMI